MQKITLIKIGGSVITDKSKPYSIKRSVIRQLAKELKSAKKKIVITHGTGSFGHPSAKKHLLNTSIEPLGIARVSLDTMRINEIVASIFIEEELPIVPLHPMSFITSENGKMSNIFFGSIEQTLLNNCIPLLHGDVIWDNKNKYSIFSSEKILGIIALYLKDKNYKIEKIIYVGRTDGVFDKRGKTIPLIKDINSPVIEREMTAKFAFEIDVTGGMKHKIEEAQMLSEVGIETWIINGDRKEELTNALQTKHIIGTIVK